MAARVAPTGDAPAHISAAPAADRWVALERDKEEEAAIRERVSFQAAFIDSERLKRGPKRTPRQRNGGSSRFRMAISRTKFSQVTSATLTSAG